MDLFFLFADTKLSHTTAIAELKKIPKRVSLGFIAEFDLT